MKGFRFSCLFVLLVASTCHAQRPPPPPGGGGGGGPGGGPGRQRMCTAAGRTQCPLEPPYMTATVTTDDTFRYIQTDTCPVYSSEWTNPNEACVFEITYRIPLVPTEPLAPVPVAQFHSVYDNITYLSEDPVPILGAIGVTVSGLNIFGAASPCGINSNCSDQGAPTDYVDAIEAEGRSIDSCGGHASGFNEYHIHSGLGISNATGREACGLPVDVDGQHSQLLGWIFDGYALYGQYSLNGELPSDLDECGGHTHMLDGEMTYHYHLPSSFPWIIGCFKGCPEISNNPRQLEFATGEAYGCPAATPFQTTTEEEMEGTDGSLKMVCGLLSLLLCVLLSMLG